MSYWRVLGLTAALGLAAVSPPALAQDGEAGQDQGVIQRRIENVVSTARKVEEPEQSTPIAMTVVAGDRLDRLFVSDLSDISVIAPNVILEPVGLFQNTASFFIRGFGTQEVDSAVDPAVGVVVDGVSMARAVTAMIDLFDVESVEVLRGPQGTLYGRNTVAGVVTVRSRRPGDEFRVRGRLTLGQYGRADIRAAVDVPLIEGKVAAKLAVMSQNSDGFYYNEFNNQKIGGDQLFALRPMIRFTPSENFDLTIIGEYQQDRGDIYPAVNATSPTQLLGRVYGQVGHQPGTDDFIVNLDAPNINRVDVWGITADANWTTSIGTFTSITNYRDVEEFAWTDLDGSSIPFFNTVRPIDHQQFTQELRLASQVTDWLDVVVGLYFFRQEFEMAQVRNQLFIPNVPTTYGYTSQIHKSYAGFINANIQLTDRLRASLGGRYTYEKKDFTHNPLGTCPGPGPENCPPPFVVDENWSDFSPKIGLDYMITDNAMVYASWSRGFRSGGFSGRAVSLSTIGPFDEEKVDAYELGLKSDWFDQQLRVNVALFWNDYTDLQRTIIRQSTTGPGNETITDNAAAARIRGIELEVSAIPFEGLTLDGSIGYLDASYGEFVADLNGDGIETDNSGIELQLTPQWQFRAAITYEFPVANIGFMAFNLDYSHSSSTFVSVSNDPLGFRKPADILNGSVTFTDDQERFRLSFFMKNMTNEIYVQAVTVVGALSQVYYPNRPRHWGVELGFDF